MRAYAITIQEPTIGTIVVQGKKDTTIERVEIKPGTYHASGAGDETIIHIKTPFAIQHVFMSRDSVKTARILRGRLRDVYHDNQANEREVKRLYNH